MKAEIISVGTELLLGHVVNTDAAHVSRLLADMGISITRIQVVGDNSERLLKALQAAALENDLIITTGGLGPTADDLTRETCATFAGLELVENEFLVREIKKWFGNAPITGNQFRQALAPREAEILSNEKGTAPGLILPFGRGGHLILLPGPPLELMPMLEKHVRPFLEKLQGGIIKSAFVRTFGIGEGQAAHLLGNLLDSANPTVAPYASAGEMFVKVTALAKNPEQADQLIQPVLEKIQSSLGNVVYGIDVSSLEEVAVRLLLEQGKTVATAESCTGGLLAKRITDCPGSSAVFHFGAVTYSNEYKERILRVPANMLARHGAVSHQVARCMAENIRVLAKADFGLGITGIAGPDGATRDKPLGLVYIALAWDGGCEVYRMLQPGLYRGREWTRNRAASRALDMLRRHMLKLPLFEES